MKELVGHSLGSKLYKQTQKRKTTNYKRKAESCACLIDKW